MSDKTNWVDSSYRSIVEYAELQIMKGGVTVMSALLDLQDKFGDTDNEVAKERVQYVINYVEENFQTKYQNTKNYLIQGMIIQELKMDLR